MHLDVPAARHVARLLLLAGVVVAAYLTLSLFARAAHADTGDKDRIGGLSQVVTGARPTTEVSKAIGVPKVTVLAGVRPQQPAVRAVTPPVARPGDVTPHLSTIAGRVRGIPAPARPGDVTNHLSRIAGSVRGIPAPALSLRLPDAVGSTSELTPARRLGLSVRAAAPNARSAVRRSTRTGRAALPPRVDKPAVPQLPEPTRPAASVAPLVLVQLPALPQPTAGLPRQLIGSQTATGPRGHARLTPAQSHRISRVRPHATPLPARPLYPRPQPVDRTATTERTGEPAGGHSPAMGTIASAWRLPQALAGHSRSAAEAAAVRGRTVRYSGPPS